MKFSINYDEENDCMIGTAKVKLEINGIEPYARKIISIASKYDCKRLLNDFRNIELACSITEIYSLPQLLDTFGFDRSWKEAILVSGQFDDFQFLENVASNRGYQIRIFSDRDAALKWLFMSHATCR